MSTKKQKRKREKERRHEYEYVYVDAEGREVEAEESDGKASARASASNGKAAAPKAVQSGARTVQPPSWRRTLRRAALFAPLMALVLYILPGENKAPSTILVSTAMLMAFFIPFSYVMDSLMYRLAVRRGAKPTGAPKKKTGAAKGSARK